MPLTLVLGPANSAKAGEVLGAYGAAARRGAVLVVPNARDAAHYRGELADRGVVLGSVLTFGALAEEIARRAGYRARRLTSLQREHLVERAVQATRLQTLAPAAASAGFAPAAGKLFAELERSLIAPARFARALGEWAAAAPGGGVIAAAAPGRGDYAREVAALYEAYHRELERWGRVDAELFMWRALDALRRAPASWGRDPVFFYGFDDLHPLELDAVETLARIAGVEVMASLTYEPGRAALRARAEIAEELRAIAERVVELPALDQHYAPASRRILHHLERQLFEPGGVGERLDPGGCVRLLESAGERAEAELVASEVLGLLRRGMEPQDIAVVYRTPAAALPGLVRGFAAYGIPLAARRRVAFAATPLGRGLLALARCAWMPHESSPEQLLSYLRTPGLLRRPELADALEVLVRRGEVTSLGEARDHVPLGLGEIEALAGAGDPAAELVRQARRLLAAPRRQAAALLSPDEEVDARALAALVAGLGELGELGWRMAGPELIRTLERLEVEADAGASRGRVLVTDPLSIRALRFRAVFLCGLQEGEFPRLGAPEPFLSDELRWELAAAGGLRLRRPGNALDGERYLFYSALSRATDLVVLSYRSSDEEGNLQLASPFLADVAELLAPSWPAQRRRRRLSDVVWPTEEAPTARELARSRAARGELGARLEPADGRRLAPSTLSRIRHTQVVSAGALEAYADCPVKWLVERELQPASLEPDSEAMVRGSYMHDVLERLLERLGTAVTPASLPAALEILERVMAEQPPPLLPGRPEPLRRAAAAAVAADLSRYLRHEAETGCGWPPRRLELRFGFADQEESLPPLWLGAGEEAIAVRGVIDRVDVAPDGRRAVVRDYKSGGARSEYQGGRWSTERRLQVALYMLAVRDLLGLQPVAGLYQPLGGRDLRARGLFLRGEEVGAELMGNDARDREGLEAGLEDAAARAVAVAARLRSGRVRPCPETCSRWGCAHPAICRST
jgi:RecB family exonuclease